VKLDIAVVEDMQSDAGRLKRCIAAWQPPETAAIGRVDWFKSGEELLDQYMPDAFHLVFMDVYMSGLNGFEMAQRLRMRDARVLIVFITTSTEFNVEAFSAQPFGYIVKPCDEQRVWAVLDNAVRALCVDEPLLPVRSGRAELSVPLRAITAAVARGHAVELYLDDGQVMSCSATFAEVEAQLLAQPRFLTCNRGVVVNMDCVQRCDNDVFRMKNGQIWPIRVRGRAAVVDAFAQYQILRLRGSFRRMGEK